MKDPREIEYNQNQMRNHLINSFEVNEVKEFPEISKNRKHGHYVNQFIVFLSCVCRRPILQTQDFIVCKICALQCHPNCVSFYDSAAGKLEITLIFFFKGGKFKLEIFSAFIQLVGTYYLFLH